MIFERGKTEDGMFLRGLRRRGGSAQKMKKLVCWLLSMFLLAGIWIPALAEEAGELEDSAAGNDYVFPDYSYEELTVGNPTPVEGNFFTDLWGNNTSDLDVRQLLHGYNLVSWDEENGMYIMNPTVVTEGGTVVLDSEEGDRSYLMTIYSDLKYSDGTPITTRDYAFTLLMQISPVIAELGGTPLRIDYIDGYEEYMAGNPVLRGVRILGDSQMMITVRHEYLPFFYELGLLDCLPYPIHVIAPGCEVKDDGDGAYIEGPFTAELLRQTILDPETGYLSHPGVVSGPYTLTSFDGSVCEFERNTYFKGDSEGNIPMIERLRLVPVENETMMDQLGRGEVGLLNKVTRADVIAQGDQLISTGYYSASNYPRLGLTFISFNCERPTVSSAAVRRAIAFCLDKNQLIQEYTGYYGMSVDGYYGLGQWMYQLINGTILYPVEEPEVNTAEAQAEYEAALAAWQELSMDSIPKYTRDTSAAIRLLEEDGWKPGADGIREKEGVRLQLTLAYPEGNAIVSGMQEHFLPWLREAGIELTLQPMKMEELLDQFYHRGERTADMLYLGSNFDMMFDPATHFQHGETGNPSWDYTEAEDEKLYQLALSMRQTEPGDLLTYCQRWLAFQQRFAEVEPMIPLYSNVYFDFFPLILHNYYPTGSATWSEAVLEAYLSDVQDVEEEIEEGLEEETEGMETFPDE